MGWKRKQKIHADIAQRSYFQWNLIRSLAFGERDWIVLCAVFFVLSAEREFLSVTGFCAMLMGIFFLGPIFGMFIHLTTKFLYFHRKKRGTLPQTPEGLRRITWVANAICAPVIIILGWYAFDLFYQSVESIVKAGSDTAQAFTPQ
ncbi:MAG: hypothetical protein RBS08_00290 [Bdellovibrionales bacterium]|jgi:heme/copper-type cytochrome/quinol oxidase subunit 2|nr:hypothetical protein [Bdellovibrionales bacterium]